jgi:hypothetical protein
MQFEYQTQRLTVHHLAEDNWITLQHLALVKAKKIERLTIYNSR